ncbi:MAG: DUF1624 domain-containing protein [Rhodospirillales bacterium]|nr:DUF1624 domain-containing protein [Rhodospirillales bacterium]
MARRRGPRASRAKQRRARRPGDHTVRSGADHRLAGIESIPRIPLLDVLRGVALIGMTVFHFAYDLMFFGLQEPGYTTQLHWAALAKAVAISFLFATGASLYLAHAHAFHWTRWARRLALIVLGALAITAATWIATPQSLIFFGILHLIAFAGVAGLAFVRGPWWLAVAAAVAILAINETVQTELLDARIWQWTGLSVARPNSGDYFPVFPWLAAVLLGIGAARWAHGAGALRRLAVYRMEGNVGRFVRFLGRNSLVYYLLHQPVMMGLLWTWLQVTNR